MKLKCADTDIRINISFAAAVTLTLILDESGVCALALLCCVIHELGHIICLWVMGERPVRIVLSFYGIKLERAPGAFHGRKNEMLIFVAGPGANLILSAVLMLLSPLNSGMKSLAALSLCVGAFNMLPCRPLDGGNLLHSFLCGFMPESRADGVISVISRTVTVILFAAGAAAALKFRNFTLLATSVYLAAAEYLEKKENGYFGNGPLKMLF